MDQVNLFTDDSIKHRCKRFASLLRHSLLNIYTIDTILDDEPLKILVADDGSTFRYVKELISPDDTKFHRTGIISAFKGPVMIQSDADIVVVGANQLLVDRYKEHGFRIVPKWVRLMLPVQEEPYSRLSVISKRTRDYFRWMIKKSRENKFTCQIVKERDWVDRFYSQMYKPYALRRFGDRAVVYSYDEVRKLFNRGALAIVKKDDEPVAATVIYRQGDILRLPHTGVAEDGLQAVRDGAAFALDYYLAQYAHSEGCIYVDFGHSRPFFSDGTLRYKMNWHMDVLPDDDGTGVFAIASPGNTAQAAKFLAGNRHFYLAEGRCVLADD